MHEAIEPMSTRDVVTQARELASALNARTVEAEHLLLVLAGPCDETAIILQQVALDRSRIEAALREESEASLAAAGLEPLTAERAMRSGHTRAPQWGASAKSALKRGHDTAKQSNRAGETPADLLLGVLEAELGTVPRALAIAGADRSALIALVGGQH
jgi:ATP-dependent Clp protease ATP-binding subunit ClpA